MQANSLLALVLSLLASIAPTLLYVWLVWRIDRYEKEPVRLLVAVFVWGALPAVALSVVLELAFDAPLGLLEANLGDLISSSVITPPIEEAAKGLALLALFTLGRREFDGVLDGVIYGSLVGLGFAMTENLFYFVGAWSEGGLENWAMVVLTRAVAFGLNHAMYTSFTGAALGWASQTRSRKQGLVVVLGLGLAILTHAAHNALLSLDELCFFSLLADWAGVLVILIVVVLAWRREREWLQTQLAPELATGLLTQLQFETITSRRRRLRRQWKLLGIGDLAQARLWRGLVAAATELAFKKQQATLRPDDKLEALIAALRARIGELRVALGDPWTPAG
jgi:RsiW-degrading membrane proteinase PrsW (M82 family)